MARPKLGEPRVFRTSDEQWGKVLELAAVRGETASTIVRDAVAEYLGAHIGELDNTPTVQSPSDVGFKNHRDEAHGGYIDPSCGVCDIFLE